MSTQLRGVLQALLTPTKETTGLFTKLGVESGAALIEQRGLQGAIEALTTAANATGEPLQKYIGSIEGQTFALSVAGSQSDTFKAKLSEMRGAAGATDAAFKEQTEGVNAAGFAWNQFKTIASVAMIELGAAVAPIFMQVIERARKLVEWFTNLSPQAQRVIAVVGALAAAIGPLIVVAGTLVTAVGTVAGALVALNPVTLAIAEAIAKGIWDWFVEWLAPLGQWLWDKVLEPFIGVLALVANKISEWAGKVTGFFTMLRSKVTGEEVKPMADKVQELFSGMKDAVTNTVTGMKDGVTNTVTGMTGDVVDAVKDMETDLTGDEGIVPRVVGGMVGSFNELEIKLPESLTKTVTASKTKFKAIHDAQGLGAIAQTAADDVISKIGIFDTDLATKLQGIVDKAKAIWGGLKETFKAPETLSRWLPFFGGMAEGIKKLIDNISGGGFNKLVGFIGAVTGGVPGPNVVTHAVSPVAGPAPGAVPGGGIVGPGAINTGIPPSKLQAIIDELRLMQTPLNLLFYLRPLQGVIDSAYGTFLESQRQTALLQRIESNTRPIRSGGPQVRDVRGEAGPLDLGLKPAFEATNQAVSRIIDGQARTESRLDDVSVHTADAVAVLEQIAAHTERVGSIEGLLREVAAASAAAARAAVVAAENSVKGPLVSVDAIDRGLGQTHRHGSRVSGGAISV